MARRVARRGRGPRQTRKFVWARRDLTDGVILTAADTGIVDLLSDFQTEYGADLLGSTVMRLRGLLEFEPAAAATGWAAAGVIVGSESVYNAVPAGNAHGPLTDDHADWMAYQPIPFNDAAPGLDGQIYRWEIDVKSSRKIEELGESLFLTVENQFVGTAITMSGSVSVGLKLP